MKIDTPKESYEMQEELMNSLLRLQGKVKKG